MRSYDVSIRRSGVEVKREVRCYV